jgi:putative ABC transport system substrate-binding protein
MRRRDFLTLLGSAATAWPLPAWTQRSMPTIGFLNSGSPAAAADLARAFRLGLSETGFTEGQNVTIEYRWAEDQNDRLPALAADLVRRQVAVIAANGPAVVVAKAATSTIPIVFQVGVDPVQAGLVASLNRPGGNLTGMTILSGELGPKQLELLHELVPGARKLAVLLNPTGSTNAETLSRDQEAARALGLELQVLEASRDQDFAAAFATLTQAQAGALAIGADPFFTNRSTQLAALAARHAIPAIYQFRDFAAAGGLLSYGGNLAEMYRMAGTYTGRILKGEKPADLPVQQATKIELVINLKTAKALGLAIPLTLLGRADEVIE